MAPLKVKKKGYKHNHDLININHTRWPQHYDHDIEASVP